MPTFGQALAEIQEQIFVGRQAELAAMERWLQDETTPPSILNVSGLGGSGKTELLQAFLRRLNQRGIPARYVDGRAFRDSESRLAAALDQLSNIRSSADAPPPSVLLVDTYEEIGRYDRWFRESFLRNLDASVRVILAGRFPVDRLWRSTGGWARLVRSLPLAPLVETESLEYLRRRGVLDQTLAAQIWSFTRGHPLSLCLAADVAVRVGLRDFNATPQRYLILQELLRQLLNEVEGRALRELLEEAAMVRQFDESMLAALIGDRPLEDGFEQLCGLSIVRPAPHGLAVHDVVRRVLVDELHWRNPSRYAELRSRALSYYGTRFRRASPDERHWLVADWLAFSTRALIQHLMFDEEEPGELIVEPACSADFPAIQRVRAEREEYVAEFGWPMVDDEHELEALLAVPGIRLMVARNWDGQVVGYSATIPVYQATRSHLLAHRFAATTLRACSGRPDPAALPDTLDGADTYFIWHLAPGSALASSARSALVRDLIGLFAQGKRYLLLTAIPDHQSFLTALGFQPIAGASFEVPQTTHPLLGLDLDLRSIGPERWVHAVLNGELPLRENHKLPTDLQLAVQEALSHWSDDVALAESPILPYTGVDLAIAERDRSKAVREMIYSALHAARNAPMESDRNALRAVELAYLQRSTSHERLAERLSVSRSTLYRMLHRGCRLLANHLADGNQEPRE